MPAEIVKMDANGHIVVPENMRKNMKDDEELLLIREGNMYVLEPLSAFSEQVREDVEFAKRTEEAYASIERGEGTRLKKEDFLKEIDTW